MTYMRICNRCGARHPDDPRMSPDWEQFEISGIDYHLCADCSDLFWKFLDPPKVADAELDLLSAIIHQLRANPSLALVEVFELIKKEREG